jgi:hypothetical protein
MGSEAKCQLEYRGQRSDGLARLETSELLFRGEFGLKIPVSEMTEVKAVDGALLIRFGSESAIFHVGSVAGKWLQKILHPPSRLDKLGVKTGTKHRTIGPADPEFLKELESAGAVEDNAADLVFAWVPDKPALRKLASIHAKFLWVIFPKGIKSITEGDVLEAGRKGGLVDIKVVGFSPSHTALKFVPARKSAAAQAPRG